jgi:hypothetical protein
VIIIRKAIPGFVAIIIILVIILIATYNKIAEKNCIEILEELHKNIQGDILYTHVFYGDLEETDPLAAIVFVRNDMKIEASHYWPKYSFLTNNLQGLTSDKKVIFDFDSNKTLVSNRSKIKSSGNMETLNIDTPAVSVIAPDKYLNTAKVLMFGIASLPNEDYSVQKRDNIKLFGKNEILSETIDDNTSFFVHEYIYSDVPIYSDDKAYVLWNFYYE